MNKQPFDNTSTIIQINFQLCYALMLIVVSFWIWPADLRWWAFGLMAILCRLAASGLIFNSLRLMWSIHKATKRWREIQDRGKAPKQARLAGMQKQKDGGMR